MIELNNEAWYREQKMQDKRKEVKENFIKKFWCIMIFLFTAGIFFTACGSRGEEEAEQESQLETQPEVQTRTGARPELHTEDRVETQSDVQAELQSETAPDSESKMNNDNWALGYLSVIRDLSEDWELEGIDFSLIYINDDDIPELVFGPGGYWVSVYTWQDGQVYTVMDKESYGTWGRSYTYVPFQNIIRECSYYYFDYDDDGFTRRSYVDFYQMAETTYELEYIYGLIIEDIIKNEEDEIEASTLYYVEQDGTEWEITEEEYDAYYYLALEEEYLSLRGDSSADEIISELVMANQQLSKNEGEAEITLSDITWDDYLSENNENKWETWLHFSFSDGTVVDKELRYSPSIVKKVDFVDITGDGADEVLIYRYFANTATEYTLINFFQIEENSVTEISPEAELEELADDVWSVEDEDFSEEEYDMPVFTMQSYVKVNMIAYPDKKASVGYRDGGWQILEWFDCPVPDFE